MKSILSISLFAALFLLFTVSCSKQSGPSVIATDETGKNSPIDNNYNLSAMEAQLVGSWICTDFFIDNYNEDTVYLNRWINQQGYKNRTLFLRNDLTYAVIDSFKIDYVSKYQGNWKLENGYLLLGESIQHKGKIKIQSQDNFETSVGYFYYETGCGNDTTGFVAKGYQLYRYNYTRMK
ncbi:MAG: hypothetical protein ACXWDO_04265 [Bacteroidia bacterium]